MEEELGRPIAQVFSSISEHPIAAASLGQVLQPLHLAQHVINMLHHALRDRVLHICKLLLNIVSIA